MLRIATALVISLTTGNPASAANTINIGAVVKGPNAGIEFCSHNPESCKSVSGNQPLLSLDRLQLLNLTVNSSIKEVMDEQSFGKKDHWIVADRIGDCEDIVLKKRALLIAKGVDSKKLRIAIVRKKPGRLGKFLVQASSRPVARESYHAVLVVTRPDGDYVMDNLDNRVRLWTKTDYRFEIIQDRENFLTWRKVQPNDPQGSVAVRVVSALK